MPDTVPPPSPTIVEETNISASLDAAIRDLLCACFPRSADAFRKSRAWHNSTPEYSIVATVGEQVVGHVAVVRRIISCSRGTTLEVAGVQGVAVAESHRGTGLARRIVEMATGEARQRGIPFGLLFCVPELEKFYTPLGWTKSSHPIVMRNERGEVVTMPHKNIAMHIALSDTTFPEGPLDLRGRDW